MAFSTITEPQAEKISPGPTKGMRYKWSPRGFHACTKSQEHTNRPCLSLQRVHYRGTSIDPRRQEAESTTIQLWLCGNLVVSNAGLFTLDWLFDKDLRQRVTTELNKGELKNTLAYEPSSSPLSSVCEPCSCIFRSFRHHAKLQGLRRSGHAAQSPSRYNIAGPRVDLDTDLLLFKFVLHTEDRSCIVSRLKSLTIALSIFASSARKMFATRSWVSGRSFHEHRDRRPTL